MSALGILGAFLVFASFWVMGTPPLRAAALAGNLAFIVYALQTSMWPVLALHAALLPQSALRLWDVLREPRTAAI